MVTCVTHRDGVGGRGGRVGSQMQRGGGGGGIGAKLVGEWRVQRLFHILVGHPLISQTKQTTVCATAVCECGSISLFIKIKYLIFLFHALGYKHAHLTQAADITLASGCVVCIMR